MDAKINNEAGYPRNLIGLFNSLGIHFKHLLTLESAAYCVLHDIPLLDAAKDTALFTQRKGYCEEIAEISRCFPDLSAKLDVLQGRKEDATPKIRHVPSVTPKPKNGQTL